MNSLDQGLVHSVTLYADILHIAVKNCLFCFESYLQTPEGAAGPRPLVRERKSKRKRRIEKTQESPPRQVNVPLVNVAAKAFQKSVARLLEAGSDPNMILTSKTHMGVTWGPTGRSAQLYGSSM